MRLLTFLITLFLFSPTYAQMPDMKQPVQQALSKVAVLTGTWEGRGWRMDAQREKHYTNVHEKIQFKLDSTLILIEGRGTNDAGEIVHNAMAVLGYQPFQKTYLMNSFLSNGLSTQAAGS